MLLRPGLVLAAEEELGITAGLQDRVVQVYGGVVAMDFDAALMRRSGGVGRRGARPAGMLTSFLLGAFWPLGRHGGYPQLAGGIICTP